MKKRVVSLLLCLIMALSLIPTAAFAAEASSQDDGISLTSIRPDDQKKYYTYKFYHGEDLISTQIVKEGDTLYQPATPTTEEGKVFTGWYDKAGNPFTDFGEIDEIKSNEIIKLYAGIEDGYYVFFMNGDTVIATETGTTGTEISLNSVSFPVNADQAITGWYTDKELNTLASDPVTIETSNISLYAKVEKGHWITFDSDGGSYVEPKFFKTGANTEAPNDPAKPGYAFAGWYNGDTRYTFGSPLTENITLKAKWTAKDSVPYTVIHWQENANDNGYSFAKSVQLAGTPGQFTEDAVDENFEGFTLREKPQQKTIAGDGSTIVNVYYKRNVYKITFASNSQNGPDHLCGKEEHRHTYEDSRWSLFGGTKYKGGCYPANSYSRYPICGKEAHRHNNGCYGKIYEDLTITAKYGAYIGNKWPTYNGSNTWAVERNGDTYQANIDTMPLGGATFYGPETGRDSETAYYYVEVLPGETGTVGPNKEYKEHHRDTSPGTGYTVTKEDRYDITGFKLNDNLSTNIGAWYNNAEFYYTRKIYNIVFMNNGQEKTVSRKYEQSIANDSYTPTAPEGKEGYKFAGWYDNELCEGKEYTFTGKTMPAQNITLYAKWVAPVHTVTVYDSNRTTVLARLKKAHKSTIDMNKEMPKYTAPEGYEFLGWVLLEDGTPFNFNTEITRNYNLYAKIGSMATYTVTYNANGGSGNVTDTLKYAMSASASVKANSFNAPSGQVFLGWSTTASGSVAYYANSKLEITGNMELYAIWGDKDSTVTLTYNANYEGADPAMSEVPSLKNNALVELAAATLFTRPDYEFTGWNTQADGKGTSFAADASARVDNLGSDNVLYAQWVRQTGSLTIKKVVEGVTLDENKTFQFQLYTINDTKLVPYGSHIAVTVEAGKTSGSTTVSVPTDMYFVQEIATSAAIDNYSVTTAYDRNGGSIPVLGDVDIDGTAAVVTESGNTTVKVTNRYNQITGTLTISKELVGLNATDFDKPFSFTVWKGTTEIETFDLWTGHSHSLQLAPGKYTIVENNANVDGYKLTTSFAPDYNVEVKAGANTAVVATNTYEKITGTVTIDKVLKGLNATDFEDGFAFDIKDASGKVVATVEKVFPGMMAQPATVTLVPGAYTIVEKSADVKDYDLTTEYDKETFTVEAGKNVTVTVTNTYTKKVTPPPAEYTLSVDIQKNIELKRSSSRKPGKASFTFEAYLVDEKGNETILDTVTIDTKGTKSADGTLTFTLTEDDLSVTGHGTVYVREVKGSTRGWTYDDTVYALGVELTTDGKLNIISVDTKRIDKPATLEFTNVYYKRSTTTGGGDKPIQSVKTGDMGIAMYAMTSLLSLGGAALVIKKRKEEK